MISQGKPSRGGDRPNNNLLRRLSEPDFAPERIPPGPSTTSSTATTSDPTASIAELDSGSGSTTGDASDSLATALGA